MECQFHAEAPYALQGQMGDRHVLLGLSGGVDSFIGKNLIDVIDAEAFKIEGVDFLAQGTSTPTSSNPLPARPARST